jgi:hypothetical protein
MHDEPMNERDEVDAVIDAALATYVNAEARPGLAQRVFEVTSRRPRRRSSMRWWAVAVPVLAAAVLMAVFVAHRANSPRATSTVVATVPSSTSGTTLPVGSSPAASGPPAASRPVRSAGRHAVKAVANRQVPSALPRLEVFPAPSPLTPDEQALLVANHGSEKVSAQVGQAAAQGPVEPIHIAAIHIPPLNPPDIGDN